MVVNEVIRILLVIAADRLARGGPASVDLEGELDKLEPLVPIELQIPRLVLREEFSRLLVARGLPLKMG